MPLQDRVAVVTGASRGIGSAIALELARSGADVLVHAGHDGRAAENVAQQIRQLGRQARTALADLKESVPRAELIELAWGWQGRVDIWVNNAGVDVLTGEAAQQTFSEKLQQLWQVDVLGTIELSRAIGARMQQAGRGCIVNVGWSQAWFGMADDSGEMFSATKGAVMAFTMSLVRSLAPQVRVNVVAPGWIRTAWGEGTSGYWDRRATGESLLGRWGTPDDVASVVRFLASDDAAFVNAQIIAVDGGMQPWPSDPAHTSR